MSEKFSRTVEDFICENCNTKTVGNGFTDHCPRCLYSKHVDIHPGDRQETCYGMMQPIDIMPDGLFYRIFYRCLKCGYEHSNKSSNEDDITSFLETYNRMIND